MRRLMLANKLPQLLVCLVIHEVISTTFCRREHGNPSCNLFLQFIIYASLIGKHMLSIERNHLVAQTDSTVHYVTVTPHVFCSVG